MFTQQALVITLRFIYLYYEIPYSVTDTTWARGAGIPACSSQTRINYYTAMMTH